MSLAPADRARLLAGEHCDPHRVLGPHPEQREGRRGLVVRAYHPEAVAGWCLPAAGPSLPMAALGDGLFEAWLPDASLPLGYRLRLAFPDGSSWEADDAYRFPPSLDEGELRAIRSGTRRRLWRVLGAHPTERDGVAGVRFRICAPGAQRVSVVGDFCFWDGRLWPMRRVADADVFELFLPGIGPGQRYAYEVKLPAAEPWRRVEPVALEAPHAGEDAVRVCAPAAAAREPNGGGERRAHPGLDAPLVLAEVDLDSWVAACAARDRELGAALRDRARSRGVTHLVLGSPSAGAFAPGGNALAPERLVALVEECQREGLGALVDWTPPLLPAGPFERGFALASALYPLDALGVDGLRVRLPAAWRRARSGSPLSLTAAALSFLRELNGIARAEHPDGLVIADGPFDPEELTGPLEEGGAGFRLAIDREALAACAAALRRGALSPAPLTAATGRRIRALPGLAALGRELSELPHDRRALLGLLLVWHWTWPGKKLLPLEPLPAATDEEVETLGDSLAELYLEQPCLWRWDADPSGQRALAPGDESGRPLAYLRADGDAHAVVALNPAPTSLTGWRLGLPARGRYRARVATPGPWTDGDETSDRRRLPEPVPRHGHAQSLALDLPPRSAVVLVPEWQ